MAAAVSVFLSYRREDTRHLSARLFEQLERQFGDGRVFFDVDTLKRFAGWAFEDVIRETVPRCRFFLAVIGPEWARVMRARRNDPKDFVQIEIAIALATPGVRVIPVLVDGAGMPDRRDLPEALQGLLERQAVTLPADPHFRAAVNEFAKTLLTTSAPPREPAGRARPPSSSVNPPPSPDLTGERGARAPAHRPAPTALERAEAKAEAALAQGQGALLGWLDAIVFASFLIWGVYVGFWAPEA